MNSSLTSALQSRIMKRAAGIGELENWKHYHRTLQQMTDWKQAKAAIKLATFDQQLDKKILKQLREMAYLEAQLAQADYVIDDMFREGF